MHFNASKSFSFPAVQKIVLTPTGLEGNDVSPCLVKGLGVSGNSPAPQEHPFGQNPRPADLATVVAAWSALLPGERRKILAVVHYATRQQLP